MPNLYIIAGCNGAGKTTASFTILPELLHCKEFLNADEIARGLSPFHPEKSAILAGKLMLQKIDELLNKGVDFAIETTLASKSIEYIIDKAKLKLYEVSLYFFYLENVELAIERVKTRVEEGGHNIPEEVIRRRYVRGLENFFNKYINIVDNWILYNFSSQSLNIIARKSNQNSINMIDHVLLRKLENEYQR